MRALLSFLHFIQRPINYVLDIVSVTLLILLVLIISQDVFMRYVFNMPGKWSEELAIAMLIWFAYLGITVGYRDNKHMAITILADKLPPLGQKIINIFVDLVMLGFCLLMAWNGIKVAQLDSINSLPASGIPMSWVSIVLVVSGCTMSLEGVIKILTRLLSSTPAGMGVKA